MNIESKLLENQIHEHFRKILYQTEFHSGMEDWVSIYKLKRRYTMKITWSEITRSFPQMWKSYLR